MLKKININEFLCNGITLIVILSCYFLDRSFSAYIKPEYIDLFFYILLLSFTTFFFIVNRVSKYDLKYYALIFISIVPPILLRDYLNFHWLYIIIFYIILKINYTPSNKLISLILFSCLISVIVQMCIFKSSDGRPVLSIGDPNYSSYYIAILILLSVSYNKKIISLIFIILATLMISRVFYLWLIIFIILYFFKPIFIKLPKINSILYLITILFTPVIFSLIFIYYIPEVSVVYSSDYSRLTNFLDKSNLDRAFANLHFINSVLDSPINLFSGFNIDTYTENVFYNTPHASIYSTVFNYGIVFIVAELLIFKKYFSTITKSYLSYAFIVSWLAWQCFLGGVFFGPQIILLAIIINSFNKYNTSPG